MKQAKLKSVQHHLPENILDNDTLAKQFPKWTAKSIEDKTGFSIRHIASEGECASDLAVKATQKLFASGACSTENIDGLVYCTQSPDYILPTTACLLQDRLGLPNNICVIEINQGCSGYIYALSVAKGLIETGQANNILVLTADTVSKYLGKGDAGVKTLFGDAATATFIEGIEEFSPSIGPFEFGSDGSEKDNLLVQGGACRALPELHAPQIYMNGPAVFFFIIKTVPTAVNKLLAKAKLTLEDIDYVIFHQANKLVLEHLREKMDIPEEKFIIDMADTGNTTSSSVPTVLSRLLARGQLKPGAKILLVAFGVGYSWGGTICTL